MSSYYTTAQLEAMRKARLKQELADSIQRLKAQLQCEHANNVQVTAGSNIEMSVFLKDDSVSGYNNEGIITGAMIQREEKQNETRRDDLDFSSLLFTSHKKPNKLEKELDLWIKKVDERPIVREEDEKDRARLLMELARTVQDSTIDIEDKIKSIKMRVSSYLQGAVRITEADKEKMESTYFEYCALCEMLEVMPTERFLHRIEKEVARMMSVLEKRRQDEYVMDVINGVMEELGCHAKDYAVLNHIIGRMYSVDGHPLCDVFIGNDGSGIMFEPVGESKDGSLQNQRQIENSANSICSLYAVLEERAAEEGVILKRVYMEPTHIEEMYIQSDVSERSAKRKQRKTSAQKQRVLSSED